VKTTTALVVAFALFGFEVFAITGPRGDALARDCKICPCQMSNCCLSSPTGQTSSDAPVAPARPNASPDQLISLMIVLGPLVELARTTPFDLPEFLQMGFRQTAVPIFQRDCSYLI
jgi:hypothetical protein